jgi:hypothetical protein
MKEGGAIVKGRGGNSNLSDLPHVQRGMAGPSGKFRGAAEERTWTPTIGFERCTQCPAGIGLFPQEDRGPQISADGQG